MTSSRPVSPSPHRLDGIARACAALLSVAVVAVLAWSLATFTLPDASAAPRGTSMTHDRLVIGSLNAENFVDVFDDPYSKDEVVAVKPREQIERLAKAIRAANADALAIVEVENEGVLKAMVDELLPDMGYRHVIVNPTNSEYGTNLGLLSRLPVISVTSHRWRELRLPGEERSWRFARDVLRVRLAATPQRSLDVFIAHFRSRRDAGGDPNGQKWRLAEAVAARQIIGNVLAAEPDAWVALLGDLNDTPDTPSMAQLTSPHGGGAPLLIDAHAALPANQRITYLKVPYRSTIDYVLTSPALGRRLIAGSARVVSERSTLGGTDHAPVVAAFDLRSAGRK